MNIAAFLIVLETLHAFREHKTHLRAVIDFLYFSGFLFATTAIWMQVFVLLFILSYKINHTHARYAAHIILGFAATVGGKIADTNTVPLVLLACGASSDLAVLFVTQ